LQKSYCIECGNAKKGIAVRDDSVLSAIRWFKRNVTRNEKKNLLVVCRECYVKYNAGRKRYKSGQKTYLALGIVFMIVSIASSQQIMTVFLSLFLLCLLYFFSLLNYRPEIDIKKQQ